MYTYFRVDDNAHTHISYIFLHYAPLFSCKQKYSSSSLAAAAATTRPTQVAPRNAKTYARRRRSSIEALDASVGGSDGKSYAEMRRSSIEKLEQSMVNKPGVNRVLSLRERIALLGTQ